MGEPLALTERPQIDDPLHPRIPRGLRERLGALSVVLRVVAGRGHRMDQVVRGVHAAERFVKRGRVQHVARHDLGTRRHPGAEVPRPPGHAPELASTSLERPQ